MNLLFTGASGFLAKNTLYQLQKMGYNITTLSRTKSDINCDLSLQIPQFTNSFDTVLHTAGKAHSVPKLLTEEQEFYNTNLHGTQNLCLGLKNSKQLPQHFIFISTVAVYGLESGENIDENYPLLGVSPYAKSKIQAERYLQEWCAKHDVKLSILRPPLIAGPNPPGNLGAMINGINTGRYFSIAGGKAQKSVLMALDIANLVPLLENSQGGVFNICDDHHPTFGQLENLIAMQLGKQKPKNISLWIAKLIALAGDLLGDKAPLNSSKLSKIIKPLTFSNSKLKRELGWQPLDVLINFKIK